MGLWDTYQDRITTHGGTKRNAAYLREVRNLERRLPESLSYQTVTIFPREYQYNITDEEIASHQYSQNVSIINSDNYDEKTMISMPKEDIELGSLIYWMENYWLVTERDANTTIYTRAKLIQCNHLLRWINSDREIIEQYCVVEDGTKYLTGEEEDRNFIVTRGDSRIAIQIGRNSETVKLNRESRFLIDDPDGEHKLSYLLTKPLKSGLLYNNEGTYKFVLQEVTATEFDNHELGIADYYKYFPKYEFDDIEDTAPDNSASESTGKKVWL